MLTRLLTEKIAALGAIPFDEFMDLVLYDPDDGYFATGTLRSSKSGDFLTSPEVSPLFGATLARFVTSELERTDGDVIVEIGGGSGSLLRPLLDAIDREVRVWSVEASSAARSAIASGVPEACVVASLDDLPSGFDGVVLANEVADNIPVALAVRTADGWAERMVGVDDGRLVLVDAEARDVVAQWCKSHAGDVPAGGQVEVQIRAGEWLRGILGRITKGAAVVIDYGDDAAGLSSRRAEGTLRTYQAHHLGPDPLLAPGTMDITVDVAFDALEEIGAAEGFETSVTTQRDFLEVLGLRGDRDRMRAEELDLARSGDVWTRLQLKSRVTEIDTLLHARGLGDFRVLVARR